LPKIAFLTNCIPPYHKPVLDVLASRYGRENFRVLLSTPMESNRLWALEWDGLDVVVQKTVTRNGRWRHPRGFREPTLVHFPLDTLSQLRRFSPDVVISTEMGFRSLSAVAFTKLHRRCKAILWTEVNESTEHGRGLTRKILRKWLVKHAHGFLALGNGGVRYIESLGAAPQKIFKLLYTTGITRFAAVGSDRPSTVESRLLFVGQLIERKGLLPFTAALKRWAERNPTQLIELVFAGSGPLLETLRAQAVPANLRFEFLGDVSYRDLPRVYANAGVLVFPTLADTWGVVVNEAMAAGLPVLGSLHSQAVQELVVDGLSGWTFRADKPEEMYQAIHRCLCTPTETIQAMASDARRAALELTPGRAATMIQAAIEFCMTCGAGWREATCGPIADRPDRDRSASSIATNSLQQASDTASPGDAIEPEVCAPSC
jgi:glycosyltransferase involved in cell wall biosynthesis